MTYEPKVYKDQGGDRQVIASGGSVVIENGGIVDGSAAAGAFSFAPGEIAAADLATDAVETAKIKAAAVTQAKLEAGSMVFVDVQFDNNAVKALRASAGVLVAAPGANKAIVIHKIALVVDDAAGAWTESTANLVIQYADGIDITADIEATTLVGGAVTFITQGVLDTVIVPDVNAAVVLFNTGAGEWGGGNAANTLSVRTWYSVIDTIAFS